MIIAFVFSSPPLPKEEPGSDKREGSRTDCIPSLSRNVSTDAGTQRENAHPLLIPGFHVCITPSGGTDGGPTRPRRFRTLSEQTTTDPSPSGPSGACHGQELTLNCHLARCFARDNVRTPRGNPDASINRRYLMHALPPRHHILFPPQPPATENPLIHHETQRGRGKRSRHADDPRYGLRWRTKPFAHFTYRALTRTGEEQNDRKLLHLQYLQL